jgi:hypothetical protein
MSRLAFPSLLFSLDAGFLSCTLASTCLCLETSIRFPGLQLVQVALLVVQSLHSHLSVGSFVLAACLNSQMVWYVS